MPASQFGGSANRVRRQVTGTMSTGPIPTFFDGTYHPEAAAGSRKPKAQLHPAPAWRYLYNSALLVLDAAMMLIACGLVFLISGNGAPYGAAGDLRRRSTDLGGAVRGVAAELGRVPRLCPPCYG